MNMSTAYAPPINAKAFGSSPAEAARNVLTAYWDGALPVDLDSIADELGLTLVARGGPGDSDYEFSGYFSRTPEGGIVEFNCRDSGVRQRFTKAHEIGHFALGHSSAPRHDSPQTFRSAVADPKERAANQFAAELLMPARAVRRLVESGRFEDVDELASVFKVSNAAMGYRLVNLGLDL